MLTEKTKDCIEYYLQVDTVGDPLLRAKVYLLAQLSDEKAFNQLRTREQLGYVVHTSARPATTGIGYRVIIQSERSTEYLESRINAFLATLGESIRAMPASEFDGHRRSLIAKRLERLKNLSEELSRFWSHIASEYCAFTQAETDAEHLRHITQPDMIAFFDRYINPTSPHRAKVSTHLFSQAAPAEVAPAMSADEQRAKVVGLVAKNLNTAGVGVDHEALAARFAKLDIGAGDQTALSIALTSYLREDAALPEPRADAVVQEAGRVLATALPGLGIEVQTPPARGEAELPHAPEMKPSEIIGDAVAWKMGLGVGPAPRPIEDLSVYEELEPKL